MPAITASIAVPDYDFSGHMRTLDAVLKNQIRIAAQAWLRAVIPKVPVYTGMARSSLAPLGRFINIAVPVTPIARKSNRTPAMGESQSHFEFYDNGVVYNFQWSTSVIHFIANEFYASSLPLTHPTPWNAMQAGERAFNKYVKDILPTRIPGAGQFIKSTIIVMRR